MIKWINDKLRGWRTWIINIALAIVPVLQLTEWAAIIPREWMPYYALGMALVNLWLRKITTTALGEKL